MLENPGVLKDLEIRLHPERDEIISAFARNMVMKILGHKTRPTEPFRFFDLPLELRREVLQYTNLVTPLRQVQWSQKLGFHLEFADDWENDNDPEAVAEQVWQEVEYSFRFRHCQRLRDSQVVVICARFSGGYSSRCNCWTPPVSLMLTSRRMYEEAVSIFYSENRILVNCEHPYSCFSPRPPDVRQPRLAISQFITSYTAVIRYIRQLEILMPWFDSDCLPCRSDPFYHDWQVAVSLLEAHANLLELRLIICMALSPPPYEAFIISNWEQFEKDRAESKGNMEVMLKTHNTLLQPLQQLQTMKCFIVHLEWGGTGPRTITLESWFHVMGDTSSKILV